MKIGTLTRFLSFIVITIAVIQLYIVYLIVWPVNIIDIYEPLEVESINDIHAGDYVFYSMKYTKHKALSCTVSRQLINEFIVTFPATESNLPVGKKVIKGSIKIPEESRLGIYKLRVTLKYHVNVLRTIIYTVESPWFELKPPREQRKEK